MDTASLTARESLRRRGAIVQCRVRCCGASSSLLTEVKNIHSQDLTKCDHLTVAQSENCVFATRFRERDAPAAPRRGHHTRARVRIVPRRALQKRALTGETHVGAFGVGGVH